MLPFTVLLGSISPLFPPLLCGWNAWCPSSAVWLDDASFSAVNLRLIWVLFFTLLLEQLPSVTARIVSMLSFIYSSVGICAVFLSAVGKELVR